MSLFTTSTESPAATVTVSEPSENWPLISLNVTSLEVTLETLNTGSPLGTLSPADTV